jgi:membrane-associated PAP2 superfamily phosphatase
MNQRHIMFSFFAILLLCGLLSPQGGSPLTRLQQALSDLCGQVRDLVPIAAMLMVLLSSVIYATGQMMGAETRARANVWSTSCLTGALVGILISVITPGVLATIAGPGTIIDC